MRAGPEGRPALQQLLGFLETELLSHRPCLPLMEPRLRRGPLTCSPGPSWGGGVQVLR